MIRWVLRFPVHVNKIWNIWIKDCCWLAKCLCIWVHDGFIKFFTSEVYGLHDRIISLRAEGWVNNISLTPLSDLWLRPCSLFLVFCNCSRRFLFKIFFFIMWHVFVFLLRLTIIMFWYRLDLPFSQSKHFT